VKRILFLFTLLLLITSNVSLGDTILTYYIYWGFFKIGVARIEIRENFYKAIAYTVGLGNFFYPYYAEWTTIVDKQGMPVRSEIYSKHAKKERKKVVSFEKKSSKVIYQKVLPKIEKPEVVNATYPLYDELSAFINSFYLDYQKKKVWTFPLLIKKQRCFVKVMFKKELPCPGTGPGSGREKCFFLQVNLPQKSELLKRSKKVEIYLNEKMRYPLLIKGHLPLLGSLKGKIEKVERK